MIKQILVGLQAFQDQIEANIKRENKMPTIMNNKQETSDGGRISFDSIGRKMITYRAIPHPIPEVWRKELMSFGKIGKTEGTIAEVIRIEAQIRALFGVEMSREYQGRR
jgi:hypothetical protein